MDKILTAQGLRVRCIDRPGDAPQACVLEGLWHAERYHGLMPWRGRFDLAAQDFVVLITRQDGATLGLLAASERDTGCEPFLLLESVFVAPPARGMNLFQRMIAVLLLHTARLDRMPAGIVACTHDDALARGVCGLHRHLARTGSFPDPEANVIDFGAAGLARRAAQVMRPGSHYAAGTGAFLDCVPEYRQAVLTLDRAREARITADARKLYERRATRRTVIDEFMPGGRIPALPAAPTPRDGTMPQHR